MRLIPPVVRVALLHALTGSLRMPVIYVRYPKVTDLSC